MGLVAERLAMQGSPEGFSRRKRVDQTHSMMQPSAGCGLKQRGKPSQVECDLVPWIPAMRRLNGAWLNGGIVWLRQRDCVSGSWMGWKYSVALR